MWKSGRFLPGFPSAVERVEKSVLVFWTFPRFPRRVIPTASWFWQARGCSRLPPLKHSSRTSGMLSVLELADLGSSHLSRVLASRRSLKRLLGSRSSSRLGLGGPMATSGFLLHLDAGFPAPTLLLVIDAVFQNPIGAARDRTRHRRLGHIGQLVSPQPAVAPGERILAVSRRVHRRDQRPTQPHRPLTRNAPAHRAFAALVQARRQPGVVHQRPGGVEAFQLPDLAPDHRRENVTQSGKGLQPGDLGKVLLHASQTGLALLAFGGEKIVEAQELLHALARGFGQLLLLQPGPTRGGEGVRPTQSRHLQQTAHPVLDPRPQHRHPAALPSPQPQLANGPGWKPSLRQRSCSLTESLRARRLASRRSVFCLRRLSIPAVCTQCARSRQPASSSTLITKWPLVETSRAIWASGGSWVSKLSQFSRVLSMLGNMLSFPSGRCTAKVHCCL